MSSALRPDPKRYPVDALVPQIQQALDGHGTAVLQAEPGAGKSTRIPLWLLNEPWLGDSKILLLEPRRIAALLIAERLADTLDESVGETVGCRMRLDTRVGPNTRIEVITEGVLTRMIQDDPELSGVGLIIFDEFHERSLHADLGLALALDVRRALRDDLRLLIASATIDVKGIAEFLDGAPIVSSPGRCFPVDTHYLEFQPERDIPQRCADGLLRALRETDDGDVLVFLPGEWEIDRCATLARSRLPEGVQLFTLFGRLSLHEQQAALKPLADGGRKVVLATNVAESSLTVQGVRVVVDSGYEKILTFHSESGMSRLHAQWISRASADQRAGRAGREASGTCYRLWTQPFHQRMRDYSNPEILNADMIPTALEIAAWGASSPDDVSWLTPPPTRAWENAVDTLRALGALDDHGRVTDTGRAMAALPIHPRLARIVVGARNSGERVLACELAALLSERDIFARSDDCDLRRRVDRLRNEAMGGAHAGGVKRCRRLADDLTRRTRVRGRGAAAEVAGRVLATGFPDRIAASRDGDPHRYLLANGKGCVVAEADALAGTPFLVVPEVGGGTTDAVIRLAVPIEADELTRLFKHRLVRRETVKWDNQQGRVVATVAVMLGEIALKSGPQERPEPARVVEAIAQGIRQRGLSVLNWTPKADALRRRLTFLHSREPDAWPDVSDDALLEGLGDWLPYLAGCTKLADLRRVELCQALLGILKWDQRRELDRLAPERVQVPSGSSMAIDYSDPQKPALVVQIQRMFGSTTTPAIYGGHVKLTIHLTSPAQRPVQVTNDLEGFWSGSYAHVRKELRGRYPKHYWPEDPRRADPTNVTKKRMT